MIDHLLRWADIVIIDEELVTAKNITYQRAKTYRPNIVYCSIEKFDELVLQGLTGAASCQPEEYTGDSYLTSHGRRSSGMFPGIDIRRRGSPPYYATRMYGEEKGATIQPGFSSMSIYAKAIGAYVANSVMAALYSLSTNGVGQKIHVHSTVAACHYSMPDVQWNNIWPEGKFLPGFPELVECYTIVKTSDHKEIFTIAVGDKEWEDARVGYIDAAVKNHSTYCEIVNEKSSDLQWRLNNIGICYEIVVYAASQTTYQQFLDAEGVLVGPVNTRESMLEDPHIVSGQYLSEVNHPQMGRQRVTLPPVSFSKNPSSVRRSASLLDEDRELVLNMVGMIPPTSQ